MLIRELPSKLYKDGERMAMRKIDDPLPDVFPQDIFVASAYDLGGVCHFVRYVNDKIAIAEIPQGGLVVSGDFSGCWMAKFILGEKVYAGHIAMEMNGVKLLGNFLTFAREKQARILALFKPVALAPLNYKNVYGSCIGVITPRNRKIYINIEKGTYRAYEPREILSDNDPQCNADGTWKENEYGEVYINVNTDLLSI